MNEKRYEKRLELQQKLISRQSKQIDDLKMQITKLELECESKNELIKSIDSLKYEFDKNIHEIKQKKKEYHILIEELKNMKKIVNQEVYRGRWKIVRWIINFI